MTISLAYNPTSSVVVVDSLGHSIGGQLWGPVDTTDELAKRALDSGLLVLADEDSARGSDRAEMREALEALDDRRTRTEEARSLDKRELLEQLPEETVAALPTGGDGLPSKDDLVAAAATTDSDGDTSSSAPKTPRRGQK